MIPPPPSPLLPLMPPQVGVDPYDHRAMNHPADRYQMQLQGLSSLEEQVREREREKKKALLAPPGFFRPRA